MSNKDVDEDPYAVSSDSDDDDAGGKRKAPPPKIDIGRTDADFKQIKESLATDEKKAVKDEKTLEEIEELRRSKAEELSRVKREFEQGTIGTLETATNKEEVTGLDRQTLTSFKDKFEHMDTTLEQNMEERMRTLEKSTLEGVGKENLSSMKEMFENEPNKEFSGGTQLEELLDLKRSEADKKRLVGTFTQRDEEEPKNCCMCDKVVYPVEKVVASKRLYHANCFKCSKCGKKLSPTTFNSHKGQLFCKPHMLEVLHPEKAGTFSTEELEGDQTILVDADDEGDDEEFAVSSRPKQLGADVIRAGGTNISDELSQLKSLKEKKENWQSSVAEAQAEGPKSAIEEVATGRVKDNLDKFISGADSSAVLDDEEKRKELESLREQVSDVKNKWKTGDVEGAESKEDESKRDELEQLKQTGVKVKERFQPPTDSEVQKSYDQSEALQGSGAADARKSFLEGLAFAGGPAESAAANELEALKFTELKGFKDKFERGQADDVVEKSAVEAIDVQLKSLKQAFEKPEAEMSVEERAEMKKREIEEEFLRYKMARKLRKQQKDEGGEGVESAEVDSIKTRLETGEAFSATQGGERGGGLDVEFKIAGKAREKFKSIEAQNPGGAPVPKGAQQGIKPSKWDKKEGPVAEVINKREIQEEDSDEDEAFDVKNLMNKFKNIEGLAPKQIERKLDELEALRVEAKNLRQRFEQAGADDAEQSEERKRMLDEEFALLKDERERAKRELEVEQAEAAAGEAGQKEEVQVVAEHASKMTQKWEKLQKKEAKKAEKSKMPQKQGGN